MPDILQNPRTNKGTAFTAAERERYKLRGLLPDFISTLEQQKHRALVSIRRKAYNIERYIYLNALQGRNERLYYRLIIDNIEELMPIIYTPTVGQACVEFSHIFRQTRGFYITPKDRGSIGNMLKNWPEKEVRLIVVTDGERILGLGDLGASGMGIPIGKLALYVACAGISPEQCLPVMIDVGTNNEKLRNDPLYLGLRQARVSGDSYTSLMDEFVAAIQTSYPNALIQFEDFLTPNAYYFLKKYREKVLCFNDDIQGTAAVALAGILASTKISKIKFEDLRIMFLGAGSAATGIADLIYAAFMDAGLSPETARSRLWFVDQAGLVHRGRTDLAPHNEPYTQPGPDMRFVEALKKNKPHILIGATGSPGTFTQEVIELMVSFNERPTIFALSNPTSRAECTAQQAYAWSEGRAIFASGSPFKKVHYGGKIYVPGQGNNAYVFPGIGLGALIAQTSIITDKMFLKAARCLAAMVSESDLNSGSLYPPLSRIRQVSANIAKAVAMEAFSSKKAKTTEFEQIEIAIREAMYDPSY